MWEMHSILSEPISLPKTDCLMEQSWVALQNSSLRWSTWRDRAIGTSSDLVNGNKCISWTDLQNKFGFPKEFFRHMQFRSLFQTFDFHSYGQQI